MKIYPAIDLMDGQVVRLAQGRFEDRTTYAKSPFEAAEGFMREGASYLHVVDLDGAREGRPIQVDLLRSLATQVSLKLQVGGGVRTIEHVQALLQAGVERVVLGSLAIQDPGLTKRIFETFGGDHITLGLDVMLDDAGEPRVATHGWQQLSPVSAHEVLDTYLGMGLNQVLCTDIKRDGMMSGPNFALYKTLQRQYPQLCILASGGMHRVADIQQLKADGVGGAIIGKALYEGTISLQEALQC
ncbi:MAG TPA: 1-(5-phosphoribosyl)-5-[(5-phosphoribosylamino)methylideneamino]imidazole-4-carboxamide isomerase [Oligoflexus sp.]|uniref:1-(5-phosphoribosyl)-5-[(5- phosphoribosylamino)methylideneamino]imidazole-4- carboxamide isomerase n=1 Tax=Oligoflexus sp. TaxID=1971216 RepID=UPI002D69003F|nr:1-(5-phosphoribosyl)-5-[(5-phosphoribosylamino)methylideneamino]imidazole-4-carboxamide isomerase [Oligoflexus sp.]HYX34003.1 1-(5-phosphoribosyl)-5-[(5-phosphoribosylamino)methylideneamino]imidazole-4-carboxamide isomerase [Oligoflexus sp.]